jgi:two-component SAPR family response regulator
VRKPEDEVNISDQLYNVFTDLRVLFDVPEYDDLKEQAKKDLGDKQVRDNKYFEENMYKWFHEFREYATDIYMKEGTKHLNSQFDQK